jgi:hypothetical protein
VFWQDMNTDKEICDIYGHFAEHPCSSAFLCG